MISAAFLIGTQSTGYVKLNICINLEKLPANCLFCKIAKVARALNVLYRPEPCDISIFHSGKQKLGAGNEGPLIETLSVVLVLMKPEPDIYRFTNIAQHRVQI